MRTYVIAVGYLAVLLSAISCSPGANPFDSTSSVDLPLPKKNPGPALIQVNSVTPASGSIFGGTSIAISGAGFQPGAAVKIGGSACTNVIVVSPSTINCKTAAKSSGSYDVQVTNPDSGVATLASGYAYNLPASSSPSFAVLSGARESSGPTLRMTGSIGEKVTPAFNQVGNYHVKTGLTGALSPN